MNTPERKYYTLNLPRPGNLPQDGLMFVEPWNTFRYVSDIDAAACGYAVYNRDLTDEEMAEYHLIRPKKEGTLEQSHPYRPSGR